MSTKKEIKDYTSELINRLKITKSLRIQSEEAYEYFKELFKGHPDYPEKTSKMTDLKIVKGAMGKGYMLKIVNSDGTEDDISWNKCIYGREMKNVLMEAMRVAVMEQIKEFREANTNRICGICKKDTKHVETHIDHVIHFESIAKTFLEGEKEIPKEFEQNELVLKCFKEKDRDFAERWAKYHKEEAVLRLTCASCNMKRPDWNRKNKEDA